MYHFPKKRKKNSVYLFQSPCSSWLVLLGRACNLNTFVLFACLLSPKLSFCQLNIAMIAPAVSKSCGMWHSTKFMYIHLPNRIHRTMFVGVRVPEFQMVNNVVAAVVACSMFTFNQLMLLYLHDKKSTTKFPFLYGMSSQIFPYFFLSLSLNIVSIDRPELKASAQINTTPLTRMRTYWNWNSIVFLPSSPATFG